MLAGLLAESCWGTFLVDLQRWKSNIYQCLSLVFKLFYHRITWCRSGCVCYLMMMISDMDLVPENGWKMGFKMSCVRLSFPFWHSWLFLQCVILICSNWKIFKYAQISARNKANLCFNSIKNPFLLSILPKPDIQISDTWSFTNDDNAAWDIMIWMGIQLQLTG